MAGDCDRRFSDKEHQASGQSSRQERPPLTARFWPNEPNFSTIYQWSESNDRLFTGKRSKAWVSGEQPPHTAKVLAERTQFFDNISMAEKQPIVLADKERQELAQSSRHQHPPHKPQVLAERSQILTIYQCLKCNGRRVTGLGAGFPRMTILFVRVLF